MKIKKKGVKKMKTKKCIISFLLIILILMSKNLYSDTFTVINTNDYGTGSLRKTINMANDSVGTDTLNFNIPGTGPHTIRLKSQLPTLSDPAGVFINGFSQSGASAGENPPATAVLMIVVRGIDAGAAHGFNILSSNNTIQGLVINSFKQNGISILGVAGGTYNNHIYCNFIGTDPTGTLDRGNGQNHASLWAGVYISVPLNPPASYSAHNNTVEANLISANYTEGASISSCPPGDVYNNSIIENYIGTDITGKKDIGNVHDGVYIGERAHDNLVAKNLISGNKYSGLGIMGYYDPLTQWITHSNQASENIIGLTIDLKPLPNSREGISIGQYGENGLWGYATNNTIGPDNIIAYNGRNGIMVQEHWSNSVNADSNRITQNSIYDNTLLGINLGNDGITINDSLDNDSGPNQLINFPAIDTAFCNNGQTTIRGTININTNPSQAIVEIFKVKSDISGYGEGINFLDSVIPDNSGNWSIIVTGICIGDSVTATTTDNHLNTSEFCQNIPVTGLPVSVFDKEAKKPPEAFNLSQNFPNPFNNKTIIVYQLPSASKVELKIYNLHGEEVRTLVEDHIKAGEHSTFWDGLDNVGKIVPSSVYFYRIKAGSYISTRKALLIK